MLYFRIFRLRFTAALVALLAGGGAFLITSAASAFEIIAEHLIPAGADKCATTNSGAKDGAGKNGAPDNETGLDSASLAALDAAFDLGATAVAVGLDMEPSIAGHGQLVVQTNANCEERLPLGKLVEHLIGRRDRSKVLFVLGSDKDEITKAFLAQGDGWPVRVKRRLLFPRGHHPFLDKDLDHLQFGSYADPTSAAVRGCFRSYFLYGWTGTFPQECHGKKLVIPLQAGVKANKDRLTELRFVDLIWGWPSGFIAQAHRHHAKVIPSEVDSLELLGEMAKYPIDGIVTARIDLIGPVLQRMQAAPMKDITVHSPSPPFSAGSPPKAAEVSFE